MRRPERQVTIRRRVEQLRQAIPELTLRTTVILGFPGETDDDFAEMLDFLAEIRFERVGAFAYSMEEGTRAAEMEGHVPIELMNERMGELMDVQREISFEKNSELVGQRSMVLVDRVLEEDGDFDAVARTIGQALDVDGVTNLCNAADVQSGNMIEVEIVDCLDYDLIGKVI
jgi:ribosomal protein S12 methylthiotransferase